MKTVTDREIKQLLSDIECFAGLEGAKQVHMVGDTYHYTKRHLFQYDTQIQVKICERTNKRNGSVSYSVLTTYTDVDGRTRKIHGATEYNFEALYHTIAEHTRHIIA